MNWASVLLYRQLNMNKCTCHFPPRISTSINFHPPMVILWRFGNLCRPLPFALFTSRFLVFRKKMLGELFPWEEEWLVPKRLVGNKMLKKLKSRFSRMKICLVFSWRIQSYFLFAQKYFSLRESHVTLWRMRLIWNKHFLQKSSDKYLLHTIIHTKDGK